MFSHLAFLYPKTTKAIIAGDDVVGGGVDGVGEGAVLR